MLDASGLIHVDGDRFLVAEDELDVLRIFRFDPVNLSFTAGEKIVFGHGESDFESLAYDPVVNRYYCTGSHGADYSRRLLGFGLDGVKATDLQEIEFDAERLVGDKVDIEALSVHHSRLLIGYRKPMRGDLALAVVLDINSGEQVMTGFNLAGRSFRDLVRIDDDNYLILAGPKKGRDYDTFPSRIFWWNGSLFSPELRECNADLSGYRAEGIAVRNSENGPLEVFVGSDESKIEGATGFSMLYLRVNDVQELLSSSLSAQELAVSIDD